MLKKLQALKAKKGFTLVELIVVIAIIAVLAAILVPTLLNQVTQSRITSANSTATTIRDTINTWLVSENAKNGFLLTGGEYAGVGATISKPAGKDGKGGAEVNADLTKTMREAYDFTGKEHYRIIVENNKVVGVAFSATESSQLGNLKWTPGTGSSSGKWDKGGQVENEIIGTCPAAPAT